MIRRKTTTITTVWGTDEAPPRPGRISLAKERQISMTQFGIKFALPTVGAPDVVTRELSITVNGGPTSTDTMTGQPTVSDEVVFNKGDVVAVVLTDVDGDGNRSLPSTPFAFTVTDTVPPPQPGEVGVQSVRQIDTL